MESDDVVIKISFILLIIIFIAMIGLLIYSTYQESLDSKFCLKKGYDSNQWIKGINTCVKINEDGEFEYKSLEKLRSRK